MSSAGAMQGAGAAGPYLDPDSIPIRWEDVTPEWMTAALGSRLPDDPRHYASPSSAPGSSARRSCASS